MKRIIVSTVCGLAALALVGCSSASEDTAIKNLSNQLDRVTNTVSSISDKQFDSILPQAQNYMVKSQSNNYPSQPLQRTTQPVQTFTNGNWYLAAQIAQVQDSAYTQTSLKQTLLAQTATLKASLNSHVKLGKSEIKALNSLTNSISKYVTSLNNTKTDIASSVKSIKKLSNLSENAEQSGAYLQSLNNHLEARMCYFRNLLNSINEAERIVLGNCTNCQYDEPQQPSSNGEPIYYNYNDYSHNYNFNERDTQTTSPAETSRISSGKEVSNKDKENKNKSIKNIDTYKPAPVKQENENNENVDTMPEGYRNPQYGYNNGYYGERYGYNNGYYNRYNNGFNPNRNTDTYMPRVTNIDTYRVAPNGGYYNNGYYNNGYYNNGYYNTPYNTANPANPANPAYPVNGLSADTTIEKTENQSTKVQPKDLPKPLPVIEEQPKKADKQESAENKLDLKQLPKTQEVKHYQSTFNIKKNEPSLALSIDPNKTNKTIEKLIKG